MLAQHAPAKLHPASERTRAYTGKQNRDVHDAAHAWHTHQPAVSNEGARGRAPSRLTLPWLGLMPKSPQ